MYNTTVADATIKAFFDFAEANKFALVKVHKRAKKPVGDGWQDLSSHKRADWERWHAEGFNLGIHAAASRLITFDLDSKHGGIEAVRARFDSWCVLQGMAPLPHHVETPSAGHHVFMQMPAGTDPMALAGNLSGKIGKGIDVLIGNRQSVAPGSYFDGTAEGKPSGVYTFKADAALYDAPPRVLEFCTPKPRKEAGPGTGDFDYTEMEDRCRYLAEQDDYLANESNWVKAIWAIRLAFGDRGWPLAEIVSYRDHKNRLHSVWEREDANETNPSTCATLIEESNKAGYREWKRAHCLDGAAQYAAVAELARANNAPSTAGTGDKPAAPRYLFETVSDLRSTPDQTWLVDRWIPDRSVGIIYGRFATGKSFIAFDLLLHLVYGMEDWHGVKLPGVPCEGLLIAREGGAGFKRRIDAFKKHHKIAEDTDRIVFMRSPVNFGNDAGFAELKTAVETCGRQFKVVVVDTVGRALPGEDMFDPKSITRFMEHLQQIGELSQGVSIGIHHENKAGEVMGSIYFDNNSDFMFHVEREGDGALTRGKITCVKQKDGEDQWARDVSYKFIGTESNGEGSLVIDSLSGSGAAPKVTVKLSPKEQLALQALADVLKAKGQLGGDIGGRSVTLDEWSDGCFSNGSISRDAARPNRDLHDRQVGLLTKGRILVLDNRVRLVGEGVKGEAGNVIPMSVLPSNAVPMPPVTMSIPILTRPS
jgi:AAA domain/Bifunctional DNA primase/polymerase, N-terminal